MKPHLHASELLRTLISERQIGVQRVLPARGRLPQHALGANLQSARPKLTPDTTKIHSKSSCQGRNTPQAAETHAARQNTATQRSSRAGGAACSAPGVAALYPIPEEQAHTKTQNASTLELTTPLIWGGCRINIACCAHAGSAAGSADAWAGCKPDPTGPPGQGTQTSQSSLSAASTPEHVTAQSFASPPQPRSPRAARDAAAASQQQGSAVSAHSSPYAGFYS